jgi:hypothetical protein
MSFLGTYPRRVLKWTLPCLLSLSLWMPILANATTEGDNPRGLQPADDATYMPELGGLRNVEGHNQYGQSRKLSECVVLRGSKVTEGNVTVPAGGLYYVSETSAEARPLARDPFVVLGERCSLVRSNYQMEVIENVHVKKREKVLLDKSGYRLWFDYSTDHYRKPYGEFAIISPSGGWPEEWSVSTNFAGPETVKNLGFDEGIHTQYKDFLMSNSFLFGASKLIAEKVGFDEATFAKIEFPRITEAVFSMNRPYTLAVRQESYRWYFNKRIYAFRKNDGILVEVRDWTGKKVLASKLLVPSTQQEYHVMDQDKMCLTLPDEDMHIELVVEPDWYKYSDFAPWTTGVPFGWENGTVNLAVYDRLLKVEDGKPWPRDDRYIVRLEADPLTGMLKRLVLENRDAFVLNKDNDSYDGPIKVSEVWDRKYFKLVADDIDKDMVKNCYLRGCYYQRTDNMILWKEGRANIDFMVGLSPVIVPLMEDTFLTRLADPTYGVPVVKSKFSSYPKVIPDAKWFAPDPTCAFVPKMKGFVRTFVTTREGDKITASEVLVVRASYVDYRNKKIIIPPAGLYYSSRDSRNVRPGESFYFIGKEAFLERFKSYLVVKKDFRIDRWKEYPMGDGNLVYWQDMPFGDGNKALRYLGSSFLWGRPVAVTRVTKYSGNDWGAALRVAPGLPSYTDVPKDKLVAGSYPMDFNYSMPDVFGEGATYLLPKWVTPDYVDIAEMGTAGMSEFTVTFTKPEKAVLKPGGTAQVGKYTARLDSIDPGAKTVHLLLTDASGKEVAEKTFGPLDGDLMATLPQYGPSQEKISLIHDDVQVDLDYKADLNKGEVVFFLASGCKSYKINEAFPEDPRFVTRPDVCGHCYQLNELILDNKETIVLDQEHPVYEGPNGYFKLVIDDFDGEAINAWHIEDRFGKQTPNLAEYARNNVDVMVGVNGTTESFLRHTLLERLAYREIWRLK